MCKGFTKNRNYGYKSTYAYVQTHTYNLMGETIQKRKKKITQEIVIMVTKERNLCQISLSQDDN